MQVNNSILREFESIHGCELCGERHVLSFGGEYYCQSKNHFAHGPGWSTELVPMSAAEEAELLAEIVRRKEATYPGGYAKWCADRGVKRS